MTEPESAQSRTPRVLPFGDCVSRIAESVSPQDLGDDPYAGLEHIGAGTLRMTGHGLSLDVSSTKRGFRKGDILFGRLRAYLRKVIRAPFDGLCSTDIRVFRARRGVDRDFLYDCMASAPFMEYGASGSEGTRIPRASWAHVSTFPIRLPPLREQKSVAGVLNSVDRALSTVEEVIAANATLRNTLRDHLWIHGLPRTAARAGGFR